MWPRARLIRGVLARHDAEEARQERGLFKAGEATDFSAQPRGGERVDAAKAAQPTDRLGVAAVRDGRLEHAAQRLAALGERLHTGSPRIPPAREDPRSAAC